MSNQTGNTLYCEWCGCEINQSTHSRFIVTEYTDKNYVHCSTVCKTEHDKQLNTAFYTAWLNQINATK